MDNDLIVFKNGELELEVTVSNNRENVWLSKKQITELFEKDRTTISRHITNIFALNELETESNVQKMHVAFSDKPVDFYSLDVILAVGYRVKSKNGVIFRKWATNVLKDYMTKGYAINQKRLEAQNKTIEIQSRIIATTLDLNETEVFNVIQQYSDALMLLDDYDHGCVKKPDGNNTVFKLGYEDCRKIIDNMYFNSDVFGVEREEGKLEGILSAVYQGAFGKEMYPSVEEKAANLLYFLIKDHPFADGCKRIAATLFLEFLNKNNHLYIDGKFIISNSSLVAITLLIAESRPEEKEVMVRLVMNFLSK